jgi:3-mercaptopyruvate sulfurtransferase SseA
MTNRVRSRHSVADDVCAKHLLIVAIFMRGFGSIHAWYLSLSILHYCVRLMHDDSSAWRAEYLALRYAILHKTTLNENLQAGLKFVMDLSLAKQLYEVEVHEVIHDMII